MQGSLLVGISLRSDSLSDGPILSPHVDEAIELSHIRALVFIYFVRVDMHNKCFPGKLIMVADRLGIQHTALYIYRAFCDKERSDVCCLHRR